MKASKLRQAQAQAPQVKMKKKMRTMMKNQVMIVAPNFKNKTRYAPYVSLGSQISHIATNMGNINRQCSEYITYLV